MVKFLGWDCAHKSLAWSYVDIDVEIFTKLGLILQLIEEIIRKYLGNEYFAKLMAKKANPEIFIEALNGDFLQEMVGALKSAIVALDNFIKIESIGVVDILNGKKVSDFNELERTAIFHRWLLSSDVAIGNIDPSTHVIIEHQPSKIGMKTNNKSTMIGHQLMFYYVNFKTTLINPRAKNKIVVKDGMRYEDYLGGRKDKTSVYSARKKHTKFSLLYLFDIFGLRASINHVPNKRLPDVADSFIQIIAYLVENNLLS